MYAHLLVRGRWHVWGSARTSETIMSVLAPADAFCAQGQLAAPFSSAIKRRASNRGAAPSARADAAMRMLRVARQRGCVSRATAFQIISRRTTSVFFSPCFASTRAAAFARPCVRAREIPAGAVRSACPCSAKRRLGIVAHGERRVTRRHRFDSCRFNQREDSSVVEQMTCTHQAAGSNPAPNAPVQPATLTPSAF
jgi:hypothetical protein